MLDAWVLFACVCALNCISIAAWERYLDIAQQRISIATAFPRASGLAPATLALLAVAADGALGVRAPAALRLHRSKCGSASVAAFNASACFAGRANGACRRRVADAAGGADFTVVRGDLGSAGFLACWSRHSAATIVLNYGATSATTAPKVRRGNMPRPAG
jgi:hypothetical protein